MSSLCQKPGYSFWNVFDQRKVMYGCKVFFCKVAQGNFEFRKTQGLENEPLSGQTATSWTDENRSKVNIILISWYSTRFTNLKQNV